LAAILVAGLDQQMFCALVQKSSQQQGTAFVPDAPEYLDL